MSVSKVFGSALLGTCFAAGAHAAVITPEVHVVSVSGSTGLGGVAPAIGCVEGQLIHEVDVYDGEFSIRFTPGSENFHLLEPRIHPGNGSSKCAVRIDLRMPKDTCYTLDAAMIVGTAGLSSYSNIGLFPTVDAFTAGWEQQYWPHKDSFFVDRSLMQVKGSHSGDFLNIGEPINWNDKALFSCEPNSLLELGLSAQIYEPQRQAVPYPNHGKVRSFEFVFKTKKKLKIEQPPRWILQ